MLEYLYYKCIQPIYTEELQIFKKIQNKLKSIRIPPAEIQKIEEIQKENNLNFSEAVIFLLQGKRIIIEKTNYQLSEFISILIIIGFCILAFIVFLFIVMNYLTTLEIVWWINFFVFGRTIT